ncbi:MAG: hypothetical protein SF028_05425 [Candidatus Sumerlaeia bacterium]|nr:hypothetical protein [Candidatus Sumerlaeia bacterium]
MHWERRRDWILGLGHLSEPGRELGLLSLRAALRTREQWLLAGVATLILAGGLVAFRYEWADSASVWEDGFFEVFLRIFIFDYLLFLLSWVSGWNCSRRWRRNSELVEELTLSPIRPAHTVPILVTGAVAVWGVLLAGFSVFDLSVLTVRTAIVESADGSLAGAWNAAFAFAGFLPFTTAAAWFHFETVRLAHAMFALGALPRIRLGRLAAMNFLMVSVFVFLLSGIGCAVTGLVALSVVVPLEVLGSGSAGGLASAAAWSLAAIPGFVVVGLLKRQIAASYAQSFERQWLLFQWWGAAESEQPAAYPSAYQSAADRWLLFHRLEEMTETGRLRERERLMKRLRVRDADHPPQPPGATPPAPPAAASTPAAPRPSPRA